MEEYYYELYVTPASDIGLFNDFILELTQNAIEEKDGSIIVRNEEPLDLIEWAVQEFANKLDISVKTSLERKQNEDWINNYKASIQPTTAGSFYIRPSWENPKKGTIDIIIDPALAFGSGHHETTSSCLLAIEKNISQNDTVLDVGCGSGILSIAAAKTGAIVDVCDTDEIAVESAKENFKLNQVNYRNAWIGSANKASEKYDTVIANIIADIIIIIANDLKKAVKSDGCLILSGILDKYLDKILDKFHDFETVEQIKKNEWYTLILKKDLNG